MKVIYLGHSGFLVETERAYYLFDYVRGKLPEFSQEKRLYVFASHSHGDHLKEIIFKGSLGEKTEAYLLGFDIEEIYRRKKDKYSSRILDKIHFAYPDQELELPGCQILPLRSTDAGVAFVVWERESGILLYHAGDLNWWHWKGNGASINEEMKREFQSQIGKLEGKSFDVAFVPLDPRLGTAYWYGMDYFQRKVAAKHVFPMHFWRKYKTIKKYIKEHGDYGALEMIEKEGQVFWL